MLFCEENSLERFLSEILDSAHYSCNSVHQMFNKVSDYSKPVKSKIDFIFILHIANPLELNAFKESLF